MIVDVPDLFKKLFHAKNEQDVQGIIESYPDIFGQENWYPLGGIDSNFAVVENQQSSPVAALVEKLTNSIDAILMRKCYEAGINPKSLKAPRSIEEAIERFFPNHKGWDLDKPRNQQAENIQILADSYPRDTANTSLIIYDDGEGQHPENFEATFLSLLRGNKNEIRFVQGKYNMGGSGAIAFCGQQRYQLIASKRFDGTGKFGFTLIRKHPLSEIEGQTKKSTWYEYFKIENQIPSFAIDELDLGLYRRKFCTGTIIKLYSYELKGNRHIRRDLRRSLNEFLYQPALPFYTVENKERYPDDLGLSSVAFGLRRQLEGNEYVEETFSETYEDKQMGKMKVTVHVFKAKAKEKKPKETLEYIQREFFKNNMAVLFAIDGQVHGHYTSEFITRGLKFNLLRDYVLIYVDCTNMEPNFRSELFMASRDRLKQGDKSDILRTVLRQNLSNGRLQEIYKKRKDTLSVESVEDVGLLQSFAKNLPLNSELHSLLSKAFKLDETDKPKKPQRSPSSSHPTKKEFAPFHPKRFPSFFKLGDNQKGDRKVFSIPLNGEKTVSFDSDVENQYFDRVEEPGDLKIALLNHLSNGATGGTKKGIVSDIGEVLSVNRKSPNEGSIKVVFKPTSEVKVGDEVQIQVDLTSPGEVFTQVFWVKITDLLPTEKVEIPKPEEEKLGLPNYILVYKEVVDDNTLMTWEKLLDGSSIEMNWDTVMYPLLEGDVLDTVYINMDSHVLKEYKSKIRNLTMEQNKLADNHYIAAIYFHTLFLYLINKNRHYRISQINEENEQEKDIELDAYLKDVFSSHYAAFLMNFSTSKLMDNLG